MQKKHISTFSYVLIIFLSISELSSQNIPNLSNLYGRSLMNCDELIEYNCELFSSHSFAKSYQNLESRSSFKMRLDSSYIWKLDGYNFFLNEKVEIVYDEDSLREIEFFYSIDETNNSWIPAAYSILYFNKEGFLIKQIYNPWVGGSLNEDLPSLTREFTYDNNDNLILYESRSSQDIIDNKISNQYIYILIMIKAKSQKVLGTDGIILLIL